MHKIVLFTSQEIGYLLVDAWSVREDIDLLVIAERTARDDIYGYRSAIDACEQHSVKFTKVSKVNDRVRAMISEHKPDLIVSAYFPHIIPLKVIEIPSLGAINIHPGLLPHYRGKFPTPWYILNGACTFGVAIHKLDRGIDTGDVLLQHEQALPADITGHELYRLTMEVGAKLLIDSIDHILKRELTGKPQSGAGSYFSSIEPRWQVDWNLSRLTIERRVRVHARPFLPVHTFVFNRMLFINRVSFVEPNNYVAQGGGFIIAVNDDNFVVSCNDGCLQVDDYDVYPPFVNDDKVRHLRVGSRLG